jgi:hypothetical protein
MNQNEKLITCNNCDAPLNKEELYESDEYEIFIGKHFCDMDCAEQYQNKN